MIKTVDVRLYPTPRILDRVHARAGTVFEADAIAIDDDAICLDGIGALPYRGPLPNGFEQAVLTDHGGRWMLSFHVPPRVRALPKTGRSVGVDVGVFYLVYTSDRRYVRPNNDLPRLDKLIEKQQRLLATKEPDSTRYRELKRRIARNKRRLYDKQLDQANKIANSLVKHYDFIALEDVNPDGHTIQHHPDYRRAAARNNWYLLRDVILLRAYETGRHVVMVPPWWTSQECSACRIWVPKSLEQRRRACPHCGYRTSRDHNAAQVILQRGQRIAAGSRHTNWFPPGHPKHDPHDD